MDRAIIYRAAQQLPEGGDFSTFSKQASAGQLLAIQKIDMSRFQFVVITSESVLNGFDQRGVQICGLTEFINRLLIQRRAVGNPQYGSKRITLNTPFGVAVKDRFHSSSHHDGFTGAGRRRQAARCRITVPIVCIAGLQHSIK